MAEGKRSFLQLAGIIVLVVVIAAGTSYGIMTFLNKDSSKAEGKIDKMGPTYSLGDFVVNLANSGGLQFIKASIVVEVEKDDAISEMEKRSPQIRDAIITILREQDIKDIEEPGLKVMKTQIEVKLNQILSKGKINNVWFTQLVVQ